MCRTPRRDATEQLLKTLTPESTTYLNSRTLASLLTQKEEKQGEALLTIGQSMQQADQYTVRDMPSLSPHLHVEPTPADSFAAVRGTGPVPLWHCGDQAGRDHEEGRR
jgi:hypothetical protein